MFETLSYRIKVPLNISLMILATVAIISLTVLGHSYRQVDQDMLYSGHTLGRVLAKGVSGAMLRDDVWMVWDTIRTPTEVAPEGALRPEVITVTDATGQVFVSTAPTRFRMLNRPAEVDRRYAALALGLADEEAAVLRHHWLDADTLLVLVPALVDGSLIGTVLMEYRRPAFLERFGALVGQVVWITALILMLILPVGWWMGMRVARPLQELAGVVDRVGSEDPRSLRQSLTPSGAARGDEIDRLRRRCHEMLGELAEKQTLAREMIRADQLAAVGRLTAGIAHEINNPLGGMLNTLSNHRLAGQPDPTTARTLSLLERGLNQIRDIVMALLVEARPQSHALRPEDFADVKTLVGSDVRSLGVVIDWSLKVRRTLPLPSTPVRQVLMNLTLNAVQAARENGHVQVSVGLESGELVMRVSNDGEHISPEQMDRLFEPFPYGDDGGDGTGLGLWVSYQIVRQLGGRINVRSDADETCFTVQLPLPAEGGLT